ncbi:MAG: hypothetical protein NVS3B26_07060 [Mycobacteriales bacterium]
MTTTDRAVTASTVSSRAGSRWPLWTALSFAVLFLLSSFVVPPPPKLTASGAEVARYYLEHGSGVRLATWLGVISGVPYALFVCWLRSVLRGIGRDVSFLGGVGLGLLTTAWLWLTTGPALHPGTLQPTTARTIADIAAVYGPSLTAVAILFAAPVALDALRPGSAFARWVGIVSAVFVAEQAVESLTIFPKSGFFAPGGGMNFLVGLPLFLVWAVTTAAGYRADRPTGAA